MDHHDQPQPTSTATTSNSTNSNTTNNPTNPNPNSMLVPKSDVRPLDVLMGRGHFHHGGNARFLRIVAERKDEYVSQKNVAEKDRIAREAMECVYDPTYHTSSACVDGAEEEGDEDGESSSGSQQLPPAAALPGRFLQVDDGGDCYRIISGKTVLDKIKMNLRQKPRGRDAASRGGGGGGSTSHSNGDAGGGTKQPRRRSSANQGKRRAADSSVAAAASYAISTASSQLEGGDFDFDF